MKSSFSRRFSDHQRSADRSSINEEGARPVCSIEKRRDTCAAPWRMCCEAYEGSIMLVFYEVWLGSEPADGRNLFR